MSEPDLLEPWGAFESEEPRLDYDSSYLEAVFGENGILGNVFSGYKPREGQGILTSAIDSAFANKKHLLTEAPCGSGKSLAALVPASYHAAHHKQVTIYVTAGINLQEQLITKDLPLLKKILPWADKFSFGLLKGRGQYLCLDSYLEMQAKYTQPSLFNAPGKMTDVPGVNSPDAKRHLPILREWAEEAIQGKHDGDVSNLPFQPHHEAWSHFSTTADDCRGKKCKFADDCFALNAQAKAKSSHIVVTNYHLAYTNLAVYKETGLDLILPPFDAVILDEAHKAAPIAEDFFGFSIHADNFKWLAHKLGKEVSMGQQMTQYASNLFNELGDLKRDRNRYQKRLRVPFESRFLSPLVSCLTQAEQIFSQRMSKAADEHSKAKEERIRDRAIVLRKNLTEGCAVTDPDSVFFLSEDEGRRRLVLQSKLVSPADTLRRILWAKTKNEREEEGQGISVGPRITVVAMSATLANGRGDLGFASRSMGAFGETRLITESPFDWPRQAMLVMPDTSSDGMRPMPTDPNSDDWQFEMGFFLVDVIKWARGRTLCLFTSYRNLAHGANVLAKMAPADPVTGIPYRILKQGDMPRTALIEEFKKDISSVLLGTESFWAGVDVPGEALSCVIVDRLPFQSPDDPVMDVISERDPKGWFNNVALPKTIIALRQGFGRGVRSETDKCCVVVLDRRIALKSYSKQMLQALPPVHKSTKVGAIADWFDDDPYA